MPSTVQKLRSTLIRNGRAFRSRHRIVEFLKTFALVAPLTLLIWIYAERSQIWSAKKEVRFDVSMADPGLTASVVEPSNRKVMLDLSGPRSRVDGLIKDVLEPLSSIDKLQLQIATKYDADTEPTLSLIELFNSDPRIQQSGVYVTAVTPDKVKVKVDPIVTLDYKIAVPSGLAVKLQNVVFDPQTISVRGPKSVIEHLMPPGSVLTVDLASFGGELSKPGEHEITNVPVVAPIDGKISAAPRLLRSMRFEVTQADREFTIRSMPINVQKRYSVEQKRVTVTLSKQSGGTVKNVTVRGPDAEIAKLQRPTPGVEPAAVLEIKDEDIGKNDVSHRVEITGLPAGVTVIDGGQQEVQFSVSESGATPDQTQ